MKLDIQLFAASKSTTFSESTNVSANTSNLTINIYFSANNTTTYFTSRTLTCSCAGQTQSTSVTMYKGGSVSVSFTFNNIGHNADGSGSASWSWSCATGTSVLGTISDSGTKTLTNIPRKANITSAPNFNDEQNPTIGYSNPAGNSVSSLDACISFTGARDDIPYRAINKTGSSYTFNLTDAERKTLRSYSNTTNSKNVMFYVRTKIGSSTYYSIVTKTLSIVNATPTFSDFEYEDTNQQTVSLTGNNKKAIINYSNIKTTISTTNKAIAQKETSMDFYQVNCGTNTPVKITYSSTNDVSGTLISATSNTINVLAVDKRNNTKTVTKVIDGIYYTQLNKGNITVNRDNGISTLTKLTLNGKIDLVNFGSVTNSIKSSILKYKQTSSSEYIEKSITLSVDSDGNFSYDDYIIGDTQDGFNIDHSYNIEVYVEDELSNITFTATLNSGIPNIAMAKNGVGIMGMYNDDNGGELQIGGIPIIETGTGYIKYSNGLMICYGKWSGQVAITSSWGYISSSGAVNVNIKFGKSFKTLYSCMVSESKTNYSAWICDTIYTTEQITSVQFLRGNSATQTFGFDYIAIGTWK